MRAVYRVACLLVYECILNPTSLLLRKLHRLPCSPKRIIFAVIFLLFFFFFFFFFFFVSQFARVNSSISLFVVRMSQFSETERETGIYNFISRMKLRETRRGRSNRSNCFNLQLASQSIACKIRGENGVEAAASIRIYANLPAKLQRLLVKSAMLGRSARRIRENACARR